LSQLIYRYLHCSVPPSLTADGTKGDQKKEYFTARRMLPQPHDIHLDKTTRFIIIIDMNHMYNHDECEGRDQYRGGSINEKENETYYYACVIIIEEIPFNNNHNSNIEPYEGSISLDE
jgi:hypothetical protein